MFTRINYQFHYFFAVACVSFSHTHARAYTHTHRQNAYIPTLCNSEAWSLSYIDTCIKLPSLLEAATYWMYVIVANWHKHIGRTCVNARTHTHTDKNRPDGTQCHTLPRISYMSSLLFLTHTDTPTHAHTHTHTEVVRKRQERWNKNLHTPMIFFLFLIVSLSLVTFSRYTCHLEFRR